MAIDFLLEYSVFSHDMLFHGFSLLVFAQKSYLHGAISDDHVLSVFARVLNLHNVL